MGTVREEKLHQIYSCSIGLRLEDWIYMRRGRLEICSYPTYSLAGVASGLLENNNFK